MVLTRKGLKNGKTEENMGQTLMNFARRRCLLAAAKSIITLESLVFVVVVVVLIMACFFKHIDYSWVPVLSLSPFQSGFCQWHSCHTALIRVCDTWLTAINQTQFTGAVFLDLKKSIWPCQSYNSTPEIISLFAEFINSVSLKVVSARQDTVCFPEWKLFNKRST